MAPRYPIALVDISGTLQDVNSAQPVVPGAIDACVRLIKCLSPSRVRFVTNTTRLSASTLLKQLREAGFHEGAIPESCLVTSAIAARNLLCERNLRRPLCLVEQDLMQDIIQNEQDSESGAIHAKLFVSNDEEIKCNPDCVLVGLAPDCFHYDILNASFRVLRRIKEQQQDQKQPEDRHQESGSPLIAIHRAAYYRDGTDGELSLGPGGFVSALEQATGLKADVVGKPSASFFHSVVHEMMAKDDNLDKNHVVMIGDDMVQDVRGALRAGLGGGILVKTGKYVLEDEELMTEAENENTASSKSKSLVVDSIVEAVDYVCGL